MKLTAAVIAASVAGVTISSAQTSPPATQTVPAATPPANSGPSNKAVNKPDSNNPGAPVAGANSFTEVQAKDRAIGAGYVSVSALTKDADGIWRGTAMKDGKSGNIAVDFKGNVVAN